VSEGRLLACGTPDEVKRLMRGTIFEIRAPRPRQAANLLRHHLQAESVGLFGDRVHVVSTRPEETVSQARRLLADSQIPIEALRIIEPSLEDVFVSVLGRERDAGREAAP